MSRLAQRYAAWLRECAITQTGQRARRDLLGCAAFILHLEHRMTRVGKIATAAIQQNAALKQANADLTAKLGNPTPPVDPSLIMDAEDVQILSALATDTGLDPATGEKIPTANAAAVAVQQ